MGYEAYSYVVYGKEVEEDEITISQNVRACNHETDLSKKFCAECGNPVYKEIEDILLRSGWKENELAFFKSSSDTTNGIVGYLINKTKSQDCSYHPIIDVSPEMTESILLFFKEKLDIDMEKEDLKKYVYTYHSY